MTTNFIEHPDSVERDAAPTLESCCDSQAGDWFCTRRRGHEGVHQAGCGYDGSEVFAEWDS